MDLQQSIDSNSSCCFPTRACNDLETVEQDELFQSTNSTQRAISDALTSMTIQERNELLHDIHGVAENSQVQETLLFLGQKLSDFQRELADIKRIGTNPHLAAFGLALQMSETFVHNPSLHLSFLRSQQWDCKKAASDFLGHFDFKLTFFGPSKLTKTLGLEDLSPQDLKSLKEGFLQLLPNRDRSGRAVLVWANNGQTYPSVDSLVRQIAVLLPLDEETQRNGVVMIMFMIARHRLAVPCPPLTKYAKLGRCGDHMPVRYSVFHFCVCTESVDHLHQMSKMLQVLVHFVPRKATGRMQFHYGSLLEWCYKLLTYGIPVHLLPILMDYSVKKKSLLEYIGMVQRADEIRRESNYSLDPILLPTNRDVLIGKGKSHQKSRGNQTLYDFIDDLDQVSDRNITPGFGSLAEQLIERVKSEGGRFLSKDMGVWLVVSDEVARHKVVNMPYYSLRETLKMRFSSVSIVSFSALLPLVCLANDRGDAYPSSPPSTRHHDDDEWEYDEDEEEYEVFVNLWSKPQTVFESNRETVMDLLAEIETYMENEIYTDAKFEKVKYQCRNLDTHCAEWAVDGLCESDTDHMLRECAPTCKLCEEYFEEYGEEEAGEEGAAPRRLQPVTFGVPQLIEGDVEKLLELLDASQKYMTETVYVDDEYDHVFVDCENRDAQCTKWALEGLCDHEEEMDFMRLSCAPACQTCHLLDIHVRCPIDPDVRPAFHPGELNALFERIVNDPYWNDTYGPLDVLSSPSTGGPWIITMKNFVSDEECARFIEIGYEEGFEISMDVADEANFDGTYEGVGSDGRTSTNAWCPESCLTDAVVGPVHERIQKLTGLGYNYSEWYQLLRYEPGQFYEEHHDYIHHEWDSAQGPRVLTVYMYLNDVEEGGGTMFGELGNLTVMPEKGRVVMWPSVLDEDPSEWDQRTMHEALDVKSGIKYGANAWIHLRDFKVQSEKGCT
eukprot:Nitzschia sp. Nitz4//scaffold91_size79674//40433//44313//NITZ4_005370-RA/size79674-processed-gene-0.95-mRNA-1//1//CDS//3329560109//6468//frame0